MSNDSHAIAEIHISSWRAAYSGIVPEHVLDGLSVEQLAARHRHGIIEKPQSIAVAELRGDLVGFSAFGDCRDDDKPVDHTGEICAIYVAPSQWRKGIGSQLLQWAEGELSQQGKREIILWFLEANAASRRFYEAHGYRGDGTRKTLTIGIELQAIRYVEALSNA